MSKFLIFNTSSLFFTKICTWMNTFHLFNKNKLGPNAQLDALQRQKYMHEIMFHVLKTKEKSLSEDVLACNSSHRII